MSVNIISRSAWGARAWNGTPSYVALSQRTEFFVHYDGGSAINYTGVQVPRAIERTHINQGWAGVGYNFVVDQAGNIYEGRGWTKQGAHCPGHNVSGIGVQIAIGGSQKPSDKALAAARALYDEACKKAGRKLAKKGHKDGIATACPGGPLYAWVKAGMPAPAGGKPAPSKPSPSKPGPSKVASLSSAVKPGATHAQVEALQRFLVKAGYGPIKGAYTRFYGPETQKAVARFHNANPRFRSVGKSYDPAIGPSGFKELQKEAGIK